MDKATKLARIEGLRAGALRVVEEMGSWTQVKMGDRDCALKGAEIGDVKILLRTPFQPLPPLSQSMRYQYAVLGGQENLPYGLDIWFARKKVLNVEWNDEGLIQIGSYRPGEWEGQLSSFASGDG
jgi:hypothetical protein